MLFKNNHFSPYNVYNTLKYLYFITIFTIMERIILIVLAINYKYRPNTILLSHNHFKYINLTRVLSFLIRLNQFNTWQS
jgi:hypothetical protein